MKEQLKKCLQDYKELKSQLEDHGGFGIITNALDQRIIEINETLNQQ